MYLKRAIVENDGPLASLLLNMPFDAAGLPAPVVLVGRNGSGKSNLLSIVADALIEGAAAHYRDAVAASDRTSRPWFRVVGGSTLRAGESGGFALLEFLNGGFHHVFVEQAGAIPEGLRERVPEELRNHVKWASDANEKSFQIPANQAERVYADGAYAYFPASRAEVPHWLNPASLETPTFEILPRFVGLLNRPIYVERGLAETKRWITSVLLDSRADFGFVVGDNQALQLAVTGLTGGMDYALRQRAVWTSLNNVLRIILDNPNAQLAWGGRENPPGLGYVLDSANPALLPLDALSGGQSTLFNTFASVLRYGDRAAIQGRPIEGICLIDEIDAHMHIDLQYRAIPELIRMFPNVQFMLSCHSPLLALGMAEQFEEAVIIELPSGLTIGAEAYSEFAVALSILRTTNEFKREILERVTAEGDDRMLVMLEGETDPEYLTAAIEALGHGDLLSRLDIEWVGVKDATTGKVIGGGAPALDSLVRILATNPQFVTRRILVLYDNDMPRVDPAVSRLHVKTMPTNATNQVVQRGIENLLPDSVFTEEFFKTAVTDKGNGTKTTVRTLDKVALCNHLCAHDPDPATFASFAPVVEMLADLLGEDGETPAKGHAESAI